MGPRLVSLNFSPICALKLFCGTASDCAVVNVDCKYDDLIFDMGIEDGRICLQLLKTHVSKQTAQQIVPFLSSLFETINGLVEFNNILG